MAPIATAALAGLGQLGTSLIGSLIARKYNSPRKQIQRLKAAGLSGNALFHMQNLGAMQAPDTTVDISGIYKNLQEARKTGAEADITRHQADYGLSPPIVTGKQCVTG